MKKVLIVFALIGFLFICFWGNAQTSNTALVVTLHPQEINDSGASWRVVGLGDEWYPSGKMLVLVSGDYTIEFKGGIKGWRTPTNKKVTLTQGKKTEIAGIYERLKGSLKVTISPMDVVNEGAQWRRVGQEVWRNNGEIEVDVPVDEYEIEFKKVPGWKVPEKTVVDLQADIINYLSEVYSREQGMLAINIFPPEVVKAGAMWKLSVESIYHASGVTITKDIGQYSVEFIDVPNWIKPDSMQVNIIANEKVVLDVTYTPVIPQEGEGTIEGEGENEGKNPLPFPCGGCEQEKGLGGIRQFLSNLFVFGISFILLGFWTGMARKKEK